MATAEQQYPGVPRVMGSALREFAALGTLFGIAEVLFALPALVVALLVAPPMASYTLISAVVVAIMMAGSYAADEDVRLDKEEYEDMSGVQAILVTSVYYTLLAGSLSGLFLWTSGLAYVATFDGGSATLGIAIAVLYPPFDRWVSHQVRFLSIVSVVAWVIAHLLIGVFEAYNLSRDLVDGARRQTSALY